MFGMKRSASHEFEVIMSSKLSTSQEFDAMRNEDFENTQNRSYAIAQLQFKTNVCTSKFDTHHNVASVLCNHLNQFVADNFEEGECKFVALVHSDSWTKRESNRIQSEKKKYNCFLISNDSYAMINLPEFESASQEKRAMWAAAALMKN